MRFRDHRIVGDIVPLAERYCGEGADELVFYDITASPEDRSVDRRWIGRVSRVIDIPFCVAGGIRSIADAEDVLNRGADKISINTPALENPALISELARRFGSQCVVIGVDSREENGDYRVYRLTGDPDKSSSAGRGTIDWLREAQERGAGEFVVNCMNRDGMRHGYDCIQLATLREFCQVPLIASGGAGEARHFLEVFRQSGVDGALAASVFHSGELAIHTLKRYLSGNGIDVRPTEVATHE